MALIFLMQPLKIEWDLLSVLPISEIEVTLFFVFTTEIIKTFAALICMDDILSALLSTLAAAFVNGALSLIWYFQKWVKTIFCFTKIFKLFSFSDD